MNKKRSKAGIKDVNAKKRLKSERGPSLNDSVASWVSNDQREHLNGGQGAHRENRCRCSCRFLTSCFWKLMTPVTWLLTKMTVLKVKLPIDYQDRPWFVNKRIFGVQEKNCLNKHFEN